MGFINTAFKNIPWAIPGFPIVVLLALVSSGWVAQRFQASRLYVVVLMLFVGAVLLITLTPSTDSTIFTGIHIRRFCFVDVPTMPRWIDLTHIDERSLNILLFAPLGLLSVIAPRRRLPVLLFLLFMLLPVFIEGTQYIIPSMGRTCTSRDVLDNLLGLFAGGVLGMGLRLTFAGRAGPIEAQEPV